MRLVVLGAFAAACGSGSATPQQQQKPRPRDAPAKPADADLASLDAPVLYRKLCAPCHGDDAKGYRADHAPSLVNPTFLESATDGFLDRAIALGRPGTSMAAYGKEAGGPLGAGEIRKLIDYLRKDGPKPLQLSADTSRGDVKRGKPIYEKSCQGCHGTWTWRGEAVHLANPRFLETASRAFLRHAIVNGRPGTQMEAWKGKLRDNEIDDVLEYVAQMGKPVEEAQLPAPTGKEPLVLDPGGKDPSFTLTADPCPTGAKCTPDPRYVSAAQVKQALDDKRKLIIIDARPQSEWMRTHITGAVSIPYLDMKRLDEIPKDGTWILTYCACPHHLSGIVLDELRKRGYAHSAVIDEGILEWHRRGYPIVAAEGVEPPLPEVRPGVGKPLVAPGPGSGSSAK